MTSSPGPRLRTLHENIIACILPSVQPAVTRGILQEACPNEAGPHDDPDELSLIQEPG